MSAEQLAAILALIGIVIVVASLLSGLVDRSGIPQVAIFLALGALLGPAGIGLVELTLQSPTLRVIATLALVLVLFTDAISVDVKEVRRYRRLGLLVLGPGTVLPAIIIAIAGYYLLALPVPAAAILGAALASTDPVMLRSLLRRPELPPDTRLALRLESGMNDVVLLPIVVLAILALTPDQVVTPIVVTRHAIGLFVLGPALGAAIGWVGIRLLEAVRKRAGVRRDYESLYALGVAFTAYAAAEAAGGSGFLAAFSAGLTIAALDVELCDCFLDYGEATAEMFLLLTFVAFGASLIWMGLGVIDLPTLIFVAIALGIRTLVLMPVLSIARVEGRSCKLIAWLGPRGLSSLLLVLLPVFAGIPSADRLFAVTSLVVLISVALHGMGIALFLRRFAQDSSALSRNGSPAGRADGSAEDLTVPAPPRRAPPVMDTGEGRAESAALEEPEKISIDEVRQIMARNEPISIVDARTPRTYELDRLQASGAVRLVRDDAVRMAREIGLSQHGTVVVYCA